MIQAPHVVDENSFQTAWVEATKFLARNRWDHHNLVVHIRTPGNLDPTLHYSISRFFIGLRILPPKDVAYTIFPHNMYRNRGDAYRMFDQYNRAGGMFDRLKKRSFGWGNYFRRLSCYEDGPNRINQLQNIIDAINSRQNTHKAAYTMLIQHAGTETIRPRGGPCLNYLAVQLDPITKSLGMLAVYRSHDFLTKAYGNYWGLCNLTRFIAQECGFVPGPLTCISSYAYVDIQKAALATFLSTI